jgi:formylglycine-generating enzyme required for sulfatase activity
MGVGVKIHFEHVRKIERHVIIIAMAFLCVLMEIGCSTSALRSSDLSEEGMKSGGAMVFVPAGTFMMGSDGGKGKENERPQHAVSLDAFWIDPYEVTNAQFEEFVVATGYLTDAEEDGKGWVWQDGWDEVEGANWRHPNGPATGIKGRMNHPVVQVSWSDACEYCKWRDKRLPTEAEWEYSCRAGTETSYFTGDTITHDNANYFGTGGCDRWDGTSPVGSFKANKFGLFDMHGNVWEWCRDCYDEKFYGESPGHNPLNEANCLYRVTRGGAWDYCPSGMRSAHRSGDVPYSASDARGFRCVKPVRSNQQDR